MNKDTLTKLDPFKIVPPILVVAASMMCINESRDQHRRIDFVDRKTVELAGIATNIFSYAARINDLEQRISALPSLMGPSVVVEAASDRLDSVGVIPYSYFRAGGYRGICRGTIRLVIGQRSRYGILTDCGRDFAEFDGQYVYGLGGES